MSRRCELSGTGPMVGNRVSHSNIKTKRRYEPNLVNVTLASDSLKRGFRLRITAAALRSVDHRGGLDAYLLAAGDDVLSARALKIKRDIKKAAQTDAAAAAARRLSAWLRYFEFDEAPVSGAFSFRSNVNKSVRCSARKLSSEIT